MDTDVIKVAKATPEDLIAMAWFSLGFRPRDSLVLIGLEGPKNQVGVILRADLPPGQANQGRLRELVRSCFASIATSPAHSFCALIISEQAIALPMLRLERILHQVGHQVGLATFDLISVTSTAYRTCVCAESHGCPREGHPIAAVMASRAAASSVLVGQVLADSEADLLADVRPAPEAGDPSAGAESGPFAQLSRLVEEASRVPLTSAERRDWWQRWSRAVAVASQAAAEPGPSPEELSDTLAGLSGAMHDHLFRDAVLLQLFGAPAEQLSAVLEGQYSVQHPPDNGLDLGALLSRRPDERRQAAVRVVLAGAARVACPGARAPTLAVLALLAWYQGKGGRSRLLAEQARADSPLLSLTGLVEELLYLRVAPPWAVTSSSAEPVAEPAVEPSTEPVKGPFEG